MKKLRNKKYILTIIFCGLLIQICYAEKEIINENQEDLRIISSLTSKDLNDIKGDFDKDGFSNFDESQKYSTDLNDPKSRPSYISKIHLLSIHKTELPIILKRVSKSGKDKSKWTFQVVVEQWNEFNKEFENKEPWLVLGKKIKIKDIYYKVIDIKNEIKEVFNSQLNINLTEESFVVVIRELGSKNFIEMEINKVVYDTRIKLTDDFTHKEYNVTKNNIISVGSEKVGFDKFVISNILTIKGIEYIEIKDESDNKIYKITKKSNLSFD